MSFRRPSPSIVALLALSAASCSGELEPRDRDRDRDRGAAGEAEEALAGTYCITDVRTEEATYHFDSPRWLLQAAEGRGPRVLVITIAGYAAPIVNTTVTRRPKESDISTAVGYSLGKFYYLQASAAYTVEEWSYRRLEAYINYARSAWVIREAGCGAVLGTGVSLKPIGVYFAVRKAGSVAVPGASVIGFLPDGAGGPGGYSPYPSLANEGRAGDAGSGDAGSADAGSGDAGSGDAEDR